MHCVRLAGHGYMSTSFCTLFRESCFWEVPSGNYATLELRNMAIRLFAITLCWPRVRFFDKHFPSCCVLRFKAGSWQLSILRETHIMLRFDLVRITLVEMRKILDGVQQKWASQSTMRALNCKCYVTEVTCTTRRLRRRRLNMCTSYSVV